MFNKIRFVRPLAHYKLIVEFVNGTTKEYDMQNILKKHPIFKELLNDKEKFMNVKVDKGACGIIWDDYFDLSCNELWNNGTVIKTVCYGKIKSGIDASKFGHQWVISYDAMVREYGEPK